MIEQRLTRDQVVDQEFRQRILIRLVEEPAKQKQANQQRQNGGDQSRSKLNRFRNDRVTVALGSDLSPLMLEGVSLLVDARAFDLNLAMQFKVFGPAPRVRFHQSLSGFEDLSVVGFDQPVLIRLPVGAFLG
jgi:hypothetical protein